MDYALNMFALGLAIVGVLYDPSSDRWKRPGRTGIGLLCALVAIFGMQTYAAFAKSESDRRVNENYKIGQAGGILIATGDDTRWAKYWDCRTRKPADEGVGGCEMEARALVFENQRLKTKGFSGELLDQHWPHYTQCVLAGREFDNKCAENALSHVAKNSPTN
ncbi:hypothetical protein [Pyxidicoccus xibeiensis]|uniref:hypothetical protein n=1 Tax=Pyxidicoccus xibeiensis TaxID=2906759 RepID=UPI0020A73CA0|nr:hypothetical protein [Pyxidicoccus xibeiensis]MCP3141607.1 hypothetical protein [Pyxidicoccus xibeiensis]